MDFKQAYSLLNAQQKDAVDTIEGPLLVLAGPGTGKTQLLGARVANILTKTDSKPENILCLTFTEKAANNMKQRLLSMIGPSARNVIIKTFHGLGAEIMNSNPDCFWNAARLEPAPEAIKLEVITDILHKLPLSNPLALKFSGQYTLVGDILKAIGKAKEAGLTPAKLASITTANLAYFDSVLPLFQPLVDERISKKQVAEYRELLENLPEQTHDELTAPIPSAAKVLKSSLEGAVSAAEEADKPASLSEWKRSWFESVNGIKVFKDTRKNEWWSELSSVYKKYQAAMHASKYFDFADMILEVITQLEQNETLRQSLQERFNYILIDEFQDTNDAQFRLSHLIASSTSAEGSPNIMAVGDDDQAIYRFQGAQLSNARQFMESYKGTKLVVLTENYRSHQSILDTAQQVAEQIEHRLINEFDSLSKHITATRTHEKGRVAHLQFPSQTEQYFQLAQEIAERRSKKIEPTAILARKHGSLERMAAELSKLNVPVRYERSSNILDHSVVQLVVNLATLLEAIHHGNREETNGLIAEVLPHPAWEIPSLTLWQLALSQKNSAASWLDMLVENQDASLQEIGIWLLELSKQARTLPLQVVIEHLLGLRELGGFRSPVKSYYVSQDISSDYIFSLTALERLRSLGAEYAKEENVGLTAFVKYLRINKDHRVVLANEAAVITGEQPVELMTVHKAKGLEFNSVYVIDVIENHWQPSKRGRTPPSNLEMLQSYGEENDDYARLLFVALTRAEQNLIVSSFQFDEHGKEVLPSTFIHHIPVKILEPSGANMEIAETTLRWPQLKNESRKELLKSVLENYQLSATGLIDYLDVISGGPEYFINRHILKIPDVRSANLSFGSAIHSALEAAQRFTNGDGLTIPKVLKAFEEALKREHLDVGEFDRYRQHGIELLDKLLSHHLLVFNNGDFPERRVEDVPVGNSSIKGVLDLVQKTGSGIRIIDYKTGTPLTSLTTTSQNEGIRAWKHRLQLTYYTLLAKESGLANSTEKISAEMIYVEAEDPRKMRLSFTPAEVEVDRLKALIQVVCQQLQGVDFPSISKYSQDLQGIQDFELDLLKQGGSAL